MSLYNTAQKEVKAIEKKERKMTEGERGRK
jgi:hypothetical protein